MESISKEWQAAGSKLASAFGSQTKSLLDGTETVAQAIKNVFADMVVAIINELEKMIIKETIALALKTALNPTGTVFGAISSAAIYAEGTDYVPRTGLAFLHQGEAVIPANQNPGGGYSGAGAGITLNLSAFNPSGLQSLINSMMPQLARSLSRYQQINPSVA